MYELKIYRGFISNDTEEWWKIWRGIDLSFQNWHEEFDKFWPEHSKILKVCTLMGFFWTKYIMFKLKKYREVLLDGTEYWCNIWRKTDMCFQEWHEGLSKFSPEHIWKSKNWDFDGVLLSKVENLWAQDLQESFVSWQWRMIQNLKRNWLVSSKLIWGIWQILNQALKNPKTLHFNLLLLTKAYNAWAKKSIDELCLMALKLMQNLKETGSCFLKIFVYRLKNSDFIL